ncbi:MAG TPA: hypothetical protein VHL78_07360 [Actinomycetota bacterium]|nr:hypothetical protein [Actinomycetota bacterium]
MEEYQDAFARIERDVDGGRTDLGRLGFWKLVRDVKVDPRLSEHWADQAGRIDRKAFERRVRPRFPVWLGNAVLLIGTAALVAAVPVGVALARAGGAGRPWGGALLVAAAGGLSVTLHDPAHWLVGRLAGIRFVAYFLDGPFRIQPGLKCDYATYLRASPAARAAMHAAGAVASKVAPFAVFAAAYLPHRAAGYELLPEWSLWAVLAVGVGQIVTDIAWSTRYSDWKKVRREARVARAREQVR